MRSAPNGSAVLLPIASPASKNKSPATDEESLLSTGYLGGEDDERDELDAIVESIHLPLFSSISSSSSSLAPKAASNSACLTFRAFRCASASLVLREAAAPSKGAADDEEDACGMLPWTCKLCVCSERMIVDSNVRTMTLRNYLHTVA